MSDNLPRNMWQIDDFDAYAQWEARQQERVEAALVDEQRNITWGDHFIRIIRETSGPNAALLVIFGSVLTMAEMIEKEEPETIERYTERHRRFLFAQHFSVVEPAGELGDTNRWEVWPITKEQFGAASRVGWDPGNDEIMPWVLDAWTDLSMNRVYFEDEPLPPGMRPA